MKNKKFITSLDNITPNDETKKRMLKGILDSRPQKKGVIIFLKNNIQLVACFAIFLVAVTLLPFFFNNKVPVSTTSSAPSDLNRSSVASVSAVHSEPNVSSSYTSSVQQSVTSAISSVQSADSDSNSSAVNPSKPNSLANAHSSVFVSAVSSNTGNTSHVSQSTSGTNSYTSVNSLPYNESTPSLQVSPPNSSTSSQPSDVVGTDINTDTDEPVAPGQTPGGSDQQVNPEKYNIEIFIPSSWQGNPVYIKTNTGAIFSATSDYQNHYVVSVIPKGATSFIVYTGAGPETQFISLTYYENISITIPQNPTDGIYHATVHYS